MKIAIGCDHGGFEAKEAIVDFLNKDYQVIDFGTFSNESVDYPDYIMEVALAVSKKEADLGIVLCGTGIGASIVANKVKGIRCALVYNPEIAKLTREHNDSNVLALGGRVNTISELLEIVSSWLQTPFSEEERHIKRIKKIDKMEEK